MTRTGFNEDDEEIPYCYVFPDIDLGVWRQVIPEQDEWQNRIPESDDGKYFWSLGIGRKGYYKKDQC